MNEALCKGPYGWSRWGHSSMVLNSAIMDECVPREYIEQLTFGINKDGDKGYLRLYLEAVVVFKWFAGILKPVFRWFDDFHNRCLIVKDEHGSRMSFRLTLSEDERLCLYLQDDEVNNWYLGDSLLRLADRMEKDIDGEFVKYDNGSMRFIFNDQHQACSIIETLNNERHYL